MKKFIISLLAFIPSLLSAQYAHNEFRNAGYLGFILEPKYGNGIEFGYQRIFPFSKNFSTSIDLNLYIYFNESTTGKTVPAPINNTNYTDLGYKKESGGEITQRIGFEIPFNDAKQRAIKILAGGGLIMGQEDQIVKSNYTGLNWIQNKKFKVIPFATAGIEYRISSIFINASYSTYKLISFRLGKYF